jgi:hypothetical protein
VDELEILDHGILRAVDAAQWDDALALAAERDAHVRRLATLEPSAVTAIASKDAALVSTVVRARDRERENLATFRKTLAAAQAYADT